METPAPEELISLATNSFDALAERLQEDGVDLDQRIARLIPLFVKLSDPKFLDLVEKMTEKHEALDQMLDIAEEAPKIFSTGVNTADALIAKLYENDIDIDQRMQNLVSILDILTNENVMKFLHFFNHHVERFLYIASLCVDANSFNERFASLLENATQSLVQTSNEELTPVKGVFGIFSVLKDKDVSKALGFGINFARKFGQKLHN